MLLAAAAAACCLQSGRAAYGFATGVSEGGLVEFKNAVLPELNAILAQFTVSAQLTSRTCAVVMPTFHSCTPRRVFRT